MPESDAGSTSEAAGDEETRQQALEEALVNVLHGFREMIDQGEILDDEFVLIDGDTRFESLPEVLAERLKILGMAYMQFRGGFSADFTTALEQTAAEIQRGVRVQDGGCIAHSRNGDKCEKKGLPRSPCSRTYHHHVASTTCDGFGGCKAGEEGGPEARHAP